MKGKGINSKYLLTSLFNMDYFHYYSSPVIFAAYLFPFKAYGKGTDRTYLPEEFDEKITNIKNGMYGIYNNYPQEGFPGGVFHEPSVSYVYFYERLCSYDQNKGAHFELRADVALESESAKQDLRYVLGKESLLLKRNKEVSKDVKDTLLHELDSSEVKDILAKLLYYLVSSDHTLPNVAAGRIKAIERGLNTQFHIITNIGIDIRKNLDEDPKVISNRIRQAKEIQICCFDGVSLFGDKEITPVIQQNVIDALHECYEKNPDFNFEMILSEYRHGSFESAAQFQVNIPHLRCGKSSLPSKTLLRLKELTFSIPSDKFAVKLTKLPLPYALFIMRFDNELYDYVKVDMYSPMIDDNKQRPSFYVFKRADPVLFEHFVSTFDKMWRSDEYSYFTERDNDSEE